MNDLKIVDSITTYGLDEDITKPNPDQTEAERAPERWHRGFTDDKGTAICAANGKHVAYATSPEHAEKIIACVNDAPELVRLRRIAELAGELRRAQLRNARFWNKPGASPGKGFEYLKQSQEIDALLSAQPKTGDV